MKLLPSMFGGIWQSLIDLVTGLFALVPQFLYFIYTCCASLLDLMQFAVRKVAGLDVYYVNGQATSGDIVSDFIGGILGINGSSVRYSSFSTVFWSLVVFGCIVLVVSTIIAIIKNQYTYDAKKSNPLTIVFSALKTLFLMAIVPLTCVFGIYLSNLLLQSLDTITSPASTTQIEEVFDSSSVNYTMYFEKGETSTGEEAYSSYDFFGARAYTNTPTFSGMMFKISARNANRVRYGSFTASTETTMGSSENFLWTDFGVFTSTASDPNTRQEEVAEMIDFAFANCLTLTNKDLNASLLGKESIVQVSSFAYLESKVWALGLLNVSCFSKYNVGLVWYYYNLWSFNYFLAYAGVAACIAIFSSVFFGIVKRLISLLASFLIFPTLVGIGPLDNNSAIGKWQKDFISNTLMAYGAVIGLNLAFMLLGEMQKIYFFKSGILNDLFDLFLILGVLAVIGDIIKMLSKMAGGADAKDEGDKVKGDVKKLGTKTIEAGLKGANVALKVGAMVHPALRAASMAVDQIQKSMAASTNAANIKRLSQEEKDLADRAANEMKKSDEDTGEFEDILNANSSGVGSRVARSQVSNFASSKAQPRATSIYAGFASRFASGRAAINADSRLSPAEKTAKIQQLQDKLTAEAIDEFRETNQHAAAAKGFSHDSADRGLQVRQLQALDKENAEKAKKQRQERRSGFTKAVLDIGGQTLKMVGSITGFKDGWEIAKKDSGMVDDANTFIQTVFKEFKIQSQVSKIDDGSSKFLTKKQKDDNEKDAMKKYREDIAEMNTQSERQKREIINLTREIERWVRRGRP